MELLYTAGRLFKGATLVPFDSFRIRVLAFNILVISAGWSQAAQAGRCVGPAFTCPLQPDKESCESELTTALVTECHWVEDLNPQQVLVSFFNQCTRPVKVALAPGTMFIHQRRSSREIDYLIAGITEAPTQSMLVMPGYTTGDLFATDLDMVYFRAETADGREPVRKWEAEDLANLSPENPLTGGFRGRLLAPGPDGRHVVTLPCDGGMPPLYHLAYARDDQGRWGVGLGEDMNQAVVAAMHYCSRDDVSTDCQIRSKVDGFNEAGVAVVQGAGNRIWIESADSVDLAARAALAVCQAMTNNCQVIYTASNARQ